jgi:hypothetical protein
MGSAASGLITAVSPVKVTVTFPPGSSPMRARMAAGITTWPFIEVFTMGTEFSFDLGGYTFRVEV